jgi:undecaprenyl diphosphate synthase
MDGNGRWARRQGLPRTAGHTAGEENLADITRAAHRLGVGWLTVFGFSTENWVRPRTEVRHILSLHRRLFGRLDELNANDVRVRWIGRPFDEPGARTPVMVQRAIRRAVEDTSDNTGLTLTVAFDYGSRAELVRAAQRSLTRGDGPITSADIADHLYLPDMPPVDVLVRTSGEARISNFLLWQIAGAAVYFTERTWPEFDAAELERALSLMPVRS